MSVKIAQGLAIAASVVLMIYAVDATAKETRTGGFLKIDTITRGTVFGGSEVVLSTAAFFVSTTQRSLLISALLIANGIVMTVGGIIATESHIPINVAPGPYVFLSAGLWVLSLGIAKSILARVVKSAQR
jgi:hypothetical protein